MTVVYLNSVKHYESSVISTVWTISLVFLKRHKSTKSTWRLQYISKQKTILLLPLENKSELYISFTLALAQSLFHFKVVFHMIPSLLDNILLNIIGFQALTHCNATSLCHLGYFIFTPLIYLYNAASSPFTFTTLTTSNNHLIHVLCCLLHFSMSQIWLLRIYLCI